MIRSAFHLFFLLTVNFLFTNVPPSSNWASTLYLNTYGFTSITQIGVPENPCSFFKDEKYFNPNDFAHLQNGDIVRILPRFVSKFYQEVLPSLSTFIVLLISGGDECFPTDCKLTENQINALINHEKIIHIFAQNCDYPKESKKVSSFPIGLDFHTLAFKTQKKGWGKRSSPLEQEADLNSILKKLKPTNQRICKAFVDFQWSDSMHGEFQRYLQFHEDRTSIFQQLLKTGLIDHGHKMERSLLWKKKGEYAFSISPPGNGLDCHRTWEDLVLGCIVIVKSSCLDPLFENLPVVIVKDWSEVTQDNLQKWLKIYQDAFSNPLYRERLTNEYWLQKITSLASHYKKLD